MDLFSLSSLFIFICSIAFALLLYSRDRSSKVNQVWLRMSLVIGFWGLGLYGVTSSTTAESALVWQYLLDISAIFIPVFFLEFILALIGKPAKNVTWTVGLVATGIAFLSTTSLFKLGMTTHYGFFWINPGSLYSIFPAFFIIVTIIALTYLITAYRARPADILFRHQARTTLIAGVIGFTGGVTNFFPQAFNIYPFGNYFVILYVFLMSYGVLRYKLFNAKIISAQLFSAALVLVFLFRLLLPNSLGDWVLNFALFILASVFSIFLVKSVYREVEQREKIESLAGQLQNFIHFLSHEIKGILGKNKAYFAAVLEGDFGVMPNEILPVTKQALKDTDASVDMVVNILRSSDLKNGKMTMNKANFDLKAEIANLLDGFRGDVTDKGLKFEAKLEDGDFTLVGDKENLISHVIKNLLANALTYTLSGSIEVGLKRTGGKIVFHTKDTGIGLSTKTKTNLFTEGGKGEEALKTNVHSTGYGLYFAKGIVDAHGGKIWAESDGPGKGSSFFVELPTA